MEAFVEGAEASMEGVEDLEASMEGVEASTEGLEASIAGMLPWKLAYFVMIVSGTPVVAVSYFEERQTDISTGIFSFVHFLSRFFFSILLLLKYIRIYYMYVYVPFCFFCALVRSFFFLMDPLKRTRRYISSRDRGSSDDPGAS